MLKKPTTEHVFVPKPGDPVIKFMKDNLKKNRLQNEKVENMKEENPKSKTKINCKNEDCNRSFLPKRPWQTFCSTNCRNAYWLAERHAAQAAYEASKKESAK